MRNSPLSTETGHGDDPRKSIFPLVVWSKAAEALSHNIDVGPAQGATFAGCLVPALLQ